MSSYSVLDPLEPMVPPSRGRKVNYDWVIIGAAIAIFVVGFMLGLIL